MPLLVFREEVAQHFTRKSNVLTEPAVRLEQIGVSTPVKSRRL
jgi:hypothetical protein